MSVFNYVQEQDSGKIPATEDLSHIEEEISLETERQNVLLSLLDSEVTAFESFVNTIQSLEGTEINNRIVSLESLTDEINKFMPDKYGISKESLIVDNGKVSVSLEEVDKRYLERFLGEFQRAIASIYKSNVDQIQYTLTWFDGIEKKYSYILNELKSSKFDKVSIEVDASKYMYSGNNYYNGTWSEYNKSMREYISETADVSLELRKYIDKNIFGGIKTFLNIVTFSKEKYIENAKDYLNFIMKMKNDMKMQYIPGKENREVKHMASDMYLGMSRYHVNYLDSINIGMKSPYSSELHRQVKHASFAIDRYTKFEISALTHTSELKNVSRKELISLMEDAKKSINGYRDFMKLKSKFSSYMKMVSTANLIDAVLPSAILMLLSKNVFLYKVMSISCFSTVAGTVNHTRGNMKQLLKIAEKVLVQGNKSES